MRRGFDGVVCCGRFGSRSDAEKHVFLIASTFVHLNAEIALVNQPIRIKFGDQDSCQLWTKGEVNETSQRQLVLFIIYENNSNNIR